jgi:uncharacterized cupredoxin-like copper-binding protein
MTRTLWPRGQSLLRCGLLALAAALVALGFAGCGAPTPPGRSTTVTLTFRYSRFGPDTVMVSAGAPVTFALHNDDPIEHEWIVGPSEVHEAHRTGTEPHHASKPTEVTVPALSKRVTTVTFDRPGDYAFICHLPGHEAYGMRGTVHVR